MSALPQFAVVFTNTQYRVLCALPYGGGCSTRTAAGLAGVGPTAAYRALVALEAAGAVVRMGNGKSAVWFREAP